MNDNYNDIEQVLNKHYGTTPKVDPSLVDRVVAHAVSKPQNAWSEWVPMQRVAIAACLMLSILAGTFSGFQRSAPSDPYSHEDAVYREVETFLFAQNLDGLRG